MAEYDFHFTAEVMDGIFGEVITARGAWDTLGERLDNMEQGTGDTYTKAEVDTMLAEKVDKVNGKDLSTNDFTNQDKEQITANKNGIDSIKNELSAPNISSSTLLADYANTLSKGYHTAFFASVSKPSDAPISDNCFVEIFVYSGSTAIMRVIPTGTAHYANNYVKTKVSGTWQTGWVVFAGTAQSGT
jgi:hypothetical protein